MASNEGYTETEDIQDVANALDRLLASGALEGKGGELRDLAARVRVRVGDEVRKRVDKGRRGWRKVVTGDGDMRIRDHLRKRLREPTVVRLKDKVSFMIGVLLGLIATQYVLVMFPALFGLWYLAVIPTLCAARLVMYFKLNYQYFLLDNCYVVLTLAAASVFVPHTYTTYHQAVFALSNGPLLWAIPTWRCSMVFHSLDKVTSVFIHAFPAMLTFTQHWYTPIPDSVSYRQAVTSEWATYNTIPSATADPISLAGCLGLPLATYLAWQIAYYVKTEIVDRSKFEADATLTTSLRWLTTDTKNPMHRLVRTILRSVGIMGPTEVFDPSTTKTKVLFMGTQLIYTLLTILPVFVLYSSLYIHLFLLLTLLTLSLWNGSSYYFDVFASRYNRKFETLGHSDDADHAGDADHGGDADHAADVTTEEGKED